MQENITVDKALSKGHRMATFPVILIFFALMGLTYFIGHIYKHQTWIWVLGFAVSISVSWIYWSVKITQWKVWAFENVRNVHELKSRAINELLIDPDYSFVNKTEIWTPEDKKKWEALQYKFLEEDKFIFEEDLSAPDETIIYYSKGKNLVEMFSMLICFGVGIYILTTGTSPIFGSILCFIGLYFAYTEYKEASNKKAQITLNNKGIKTINTKFFRWDAIDNIDARMEGSGKYTHYYLSYIHPDGLERLMIDDYNIEYDELRKLIRIYKGRSESHRNYD